MRRTVAVIGGGYGGATVAKALDEDTDVVLVEPKEGCDRDTRQRGNGMISKP